MKIDKIFAQEVLDSRGNPTVMSTVTLDNGESASAMVPSGASTGIYEAVELRDGDMNRFLGKGVLKAVENVNDVIGRSLIGMEIESQADIDDKMNSLDGTANKANLGANSILSVSMACVKAAANSRKVPLYEYIATLFGHSTDSFVMPVPMMNLLNGGKHATESSDFQEYMVMPLGAKNMQEAVRYGAEIFHNLGKILKDRGFSTTVGDEGGYSPSLGTNDEPLKLLVEAIELSGYEPGNEVAIALDPAASEIYEEGFYNLKSENRRLSSEELVKMYIDWIDTYPIVSIEDGHAEDDWQGFVMFMELAGDRIQIMGDDLFVTNTERLQTGIDKKAANSILIKLNQIGTVSETIKAINMAQKAGMTAVVSHRSGETEDTFIADLVVGAGTGQIKTGSLSRSERVSKYNRLMMIERELGERSTFSKFPFVTL